MATLLKFPQSVNPVRQGSGTHAKEDGTQAKVVKFARFKATNAVEQDGQNNDARPVRYLPFTDPDERFEFMNFLLDEFAMNPRLRENFPFWQRAQAIDRATRGDVGEATTEAESQPEAACNPEHTEETPAPKKKTSSKQGRQGNQAERRKLYGRISILLKEIYTNPDLSEETYGFDEEVFRGNLEDRYGTRTRTELSIDQLHEVVRWLGAKTLKSPKNPASNAPKRLMYSNPLRPRLQKIQALLTAKGKLEGKIVPWDYAHGIVTRMSKGKVKHLDKATSGYLDAVIAALDKDIKRKTKKLDEKQGEKDPDNHTVTGKVTSDKEATRADGSKKGDTECG